MEEEKYVSLCLFEKPRDLCVFVGKRSALNQLLLLPLFSHSVGSSSLQLARLSCPSPAPGACSNSCLLSQWCHPTISSSVASFSSCPQSFPASGFFFFFFLVSVKSQMISELTWILHIHQSVCLFQQGHVGLREVFSFCWYKANQSTGTAHIQNGEGWKEAPFESCTDV